MKKARRKNAISYAAIAIILVFVLVLNILAFGVFSNLLTQYLGYFTLSGGQSTDELDLAYNTSDFADSAALNTAKEELGTEISRNGITLLKLDDESGLPYAQGTTFSVFSQSSDDFVSSGTGSSSGSSAGGFSIDSVFEESGLHVNETLWKFYHEGNGSATRGAGSIDFGDAEDYAINEVPASKLSAESGLEATYKGTTAMFIFSRVGGEGCDLARGMVNDASSAEDKARHYLEPDSTELGVLQYLQDREEFDEIILIVNCNNLPELAWTENFSKIHTILHVPGTGKMGLYSLADILKGEVAPSGHLTDTVAVDLLASPAAQNIDEGVYFPEGSAPDGSATNMDYYYSVYAENIYVGYKYYETRYEDYILGQGNAGEYDYAQTVTYPFGYGLSTTEFAWSDYSVNWNGDECTVSVTVTNVGGTAARDVVEVYAQSPYTDYDRANGVEKSAVHLVGFAKTGTLEPNASETVNVTFQQEQLKSYDVNGSGTFILEGGNYYITAAKDAHAAINNILRYKAPETAERLVASPSEDVAGDDTLVAIYTPMGDGEVDTSKYASDTTTGTPIVNQLGFATQDDITYLTRNDWVGTFPQPYGEVSDIVSNFGNRVNGGSDSDPKAYVYKMDITRDVYNMIRGTDALAGDSADTDTVRFGEDNDLDLIDLRGLSYDDPKWDDLIAQMSLSEMADILAKGGYGTIKVDSIAKPLSTDADGATGLSSGLAIATPIMLAQTWDAELAYQMGYLVGNDCIFKNTGGWYAPSMDIHRTPFSGRNYEYYSEDGFLSGVMAMNEVQGAGKMGVVTYIKHFAFNESENHRGDRGQGGLVTWVNEQAARELYLVPFEMCVKSGSTEQWHYVQNEEGKYEKVTYEVPYCLGVMSAFNRVGYTWAGGNYPLITGILRNEWGFVGNVVTDFDNGGYMDTWQAINSGAGMKLNYIGTADYDGNMFTLSENITPEQYHNVKRSVHDVLYVVANSLAMNGLIHGAEVTIIGYYVLIAAAIDVAAAIGIAVLVIFTVRRNKKQKQTEA